MKSIKEKALNVYPKMSRISELHEVISACNESYYLGDANEEKREGFEAGANYVLEELEKVIHSSSICEKAIFDLGKLVIQLKK